MIDLALIKELEIMEQVTKDDLRQLRLLIINDIRNLLQGKQVNQKNETESDWVRSKEIRSMMNVSYATLQNLRIQGKIRFRKVMGSYYYSKKDMLNLFREEK